MRRSRLRVLGPAILLAVGGAYALASTNWCGEWKAGGPQLTGIGLAVGTLKAGAAAVPLAPPYPVVRAGYGPPRPEARSATLPLQARALILDVQGVRVGLVELDVLTAPMSLVEDVRARAKDLQLGALWVIASHTHSGFGGYDPRLISELAGTGRYRDDARASLVEGALQALHRANLAVAPATLEVGEKEWPQLVVSRDEGESADPRLTKLIIRTNGKAIAQVMVFSAHPTLVARASGSLDPDYPGRVDAIEKVAGAPVTFVLQGSVGNAAAAVEKPDAERVDAYARAVADALERTPTTQVTPVRLGFTRVETHLPRPDSRRLTSFARAAGDNFLCNSAPRTAEVDGLELGSVLLLFVPGEPTWEAVSQLEAASRTQRTVAVANGYLGYVDTEARVKAAQGEAKRQFYGPTLAQVLAEAAALAGKPLQDTSR